MAHTRAQSEAMAEARANLREFIKPGDTVYCNIKHVSRSGMLRVIRLFVIDTNGRTRKPWLRDITELAAKAMDDRLDRDRWGLKVGGCGMDMCFATVYYLGQALFPQGFGEVGRKFPNAVSGKTDDLRPLTEGKAAKLVEKGWIFSGRNGDPSGWDKDGGYALKHVTI